MIQQRAKMIGPLPEPSGPKTEITPQEKLAAKKLIAAMGYGHVESQALALLTCLRHVSPASLYARSAYKGAALPHMLIDNKYAHFTF